MKTSIILGAVVISVLVAFSGIGATVSFATSSSDYSRLAQTESIQGLLLNTNGSKWITEIGDTTYQVNGTSWAPSTWGCHPIPQGGKQCGYFPSTTTTNMNVTLYANNTLAQRIELTIINESSSVTLTVTNSSGQWTNRTSTTIVVNKTSTVFTNQIRNHTLASQEATYSGSDARTSCGWYGCAISFSSSELALLAISMGGLGILIGVIGALLSEAVVGVPLIIAGFIFALGGLIADVLNYECGGYGGWFAVDWSGGSIGCNPVPWYL